MGGYVYLICDAANDTFKIGVTRNLTQKRLKKLQTGNSTELFLSQKYFCEYPFRLEKMLHAHFCLKKERDEWFRLNCNDVSQFEETCKKLDETIHLMLNNPFFAKNIH